MQLLQKDKALLGPSAWSMASLKGTKGHKKHWAGNLSLPTAKVKWDLWHRAYWGSAPERLQAEWVFLKKNLWVCHISSGVIVDIIRIVRYVGHFSLLKTAFGRSVKKSVSSLNYRGILSRQKRITFMSGICTLHCKIDLITAWHSM